MELLTEIYLAGAITMFIFLSFKILILKTDTQLVLMKQKLGIVTWSLTVLYVLVRESVLWFGPFLLRIVMTIEDKANGRVRND